MLQAELEDMINSSTTELDPINDIEEDTAIEDIVWWEELGLLQDPFPATNGLENIKKEDYDKILVDNDGIKFAKNFKNNNKFDLGSHYLLMGDYGTGKSTVIDYMLDSCEDNEVCAFKLPLLTRTTEMEVRMSFLRLLSRRIERKLKNFNVELPLKADENDISDGLREILATTSIYKGFIFFVDDLHKLETQDQDLPFKFVKNLQAFSNLLKEDEIEFSFVFTGFPEWKTKISQDTSITSVIDPSNIISIKEVDENLGKKAIRNRFLAFRKNKELGIESQQFELSQSYLDISLSQINHY